MLSLPAWIPRPRISRAPAVQTIAPVPHSVAPVASVGPVVLYERRLTPGIAPSRAPHSPLAETLRDTGLLLFRATVTGWSETPGTATVPVVLTSPELAAAAQQSGGATLTITLDAESARYLPPRTRLRCAFQILTDEDED